MNSLNWLYRVYDRLVGYSDPRMKWTLKDMPVYKHKVDYLVGETRNHFADGHFESRWQKPGSEG